MAMIASQIAPVRPRVSLPTGGDLPLDDEVRRFVDSGAAGVIAIYGPPGSGKTTALAHLAATIPAGVTLVDADQARLMHVADRAVLFVYAAEAPLHIRHLATYRLSPWSEDELIEYLLARHHEKCASVMKRIRP